MTKRILPDQYQRDRLGSLPFRYLPPLDAQKGKTYPLVLFLHGVGECGTDNESQLWYPFFSDENSVFGAPSLRQFPCHLLAPQAQDDNRWVNIQDWSLPNVVMADEPTGALASTYSLIEKFVSGGQVDKSRIYVTGLSMGAFGVYELIIRRPDLFTAGVAVCGGADLRRIDDLRNTALRIYHGNRDKVVPAHLSQALYAKLKPMNPAVSYIELDQVGHNAWEYAYRDEALFPWLFAQSRV